MAESNPNRRRAFPFWTRLLIYAVLAYGALHVASEAKSRRIHERREKARAQQAEGAQQTNRPVP
jgi:hypothetical protein